jgi:hypothetical protein
MLKAIISNTLLMVVIPLSLVFLSWTTPITISDTVNSSLPYAAENDNGDAVIVWMSGTYPDIDIKVSTYDGSIWSTATTISTGQTNVSPSCAIDDLGNIIVAWELIDGSNRTILSVQKPRLSLWDSPLTISNANYNTSISLKSNADGEFLAAWIDQENNYILTKTIVFGSSWESTTIVSSSGGYRGNVQSGIDSTGNCVVIWEDYDAADLYTSGTTSGFGTSWSTPAVITTSGTNTEPNFKLSLSGNGIIAWTDIDTYEIKASIYESGTWGSNEILSTSHGAYPSAATSGTDYFVSWSDLTSGDVAANITISGVWDTAFFLTSTSFKDTTSSSFNTGRFYTAWTDLFTGEADVIEYPIGGPASSVEIISSGELNLFPQISSSSSITVAAWEAINGSDHIIQVNVN